MCLCFVCTAPFLTSCSDDKDEDANPNSEETIIGQWITDSHERWYQKLGSTNRENYYKDYFTITLIIQEDGTGLEIEEDGDTFYFEWKYNDKTGYLYMLKPDYEEETEVKLRWKSTSEFVMSEKKFIEDANTYRYRLSTYKRLK